MLSAASGERIELIANDFSPLVASTIRGHESGAYLLDVDTDGAWEVVIEQPRDRAGPSVPLRFEDTDQRSKGPFELPGGLVTFKINCVGTEGTCSVWLYDASGDRVELLANDLAPHSATKPTGVTPGIYWLDIDADGKWTIDVTDG